jgi:TPR repeat protein
MLLRSMIYCYYEGKGVKQSYIEAVKWYRKSAEQGYELAKESLARCYLKGLGVPKSVEEANKWWKFLRENPTKADF